MSLLITRNNATDSPASYHNYLRDTFEVPPHSEIAVHTVVINRDPTYIITDDCTFYIYHGGYLSDATVTKDEGGKQIYLQYYDYSLTLWVDQPIDVHLTKGSYTVSEFARHVEQQLNHHDFHPAFQGQWTCDVDAARAADGSFNGFKIQCAQRSLDASSNEKGVTQLMNGGLAFTQGTQKLLRNTAGADGLMKASRLNSVLHPAGGSVVFNLANIGSGKPWAIGLRRKTYPHKAYENSVPMMDFGIRYDPGDGTLKYFEWTYNTDEDDMNMEDIDYSSGADNYDWQSNASSYTYLKIELKNQVVVFSLASESNGQPDEPTTLTQSRKAVGYATYALFPVVGITEKSKYVNIHSFNRIDSYDFDILDTMDSIVERADAVEHSDQGSALTSADYLGLLPKAMKSSDSTAMDTRTALIVGNAKRSYGVLGTVMDELGYEDSVDEGIAPDAKTTTFESQAIPDMISTAVLHVRVSGLNLRTYNGIKSSISKILFTLPRFSNGSSSGRLHITPNEKTYLALNNTNTLHLNDIQVEFVNSDETLATDLTDRSYVVFHIRQGKAHGCSCGKH